MPEDVTITLDDGTIVPVASIGLNPLGKILVQALISPDRCEARRKLEGGEDLTPLCCPSMRTAAYLFRPEVKVSVTTKDFSVSSGSAIVDKERKGGTPTMERIDPENLLPGATTKQVVPYWRNCNSETDLTDHFRPDDIVTVMRPADAAEDRLGLLLRLRVVSATYADLSSRLQRGEKLPDEIRSAVAAEREQLRELLAKVRGKLLKRLREDTQTNLAIEEIIADGSESTKFASADRRSERERIEALAQPRKAR